MDAVGPFRVVGHDHPGVAKAAEVLRWIKAQTTHGAEAASPFPLVLAPQRLGSVLDHDQIVPLGNLPDRLHVVRLAEQVDRQDGSRPRCDLAFDLDRVEVERDRVDIDEDRPQA